MAGPNFNKNSGKGRLAADRYDFENHTGGAGRRHKDDQIDISAALEGITADTVHDALVSLNDKILNFDFFVTIGEGYDVYETGTFNALAPNLDVELNEVLYNVNNPKNQRLRDGGIIVIKSGTYKIATTVDIPAGITIMGEGFGTKLINTTASLEPMFRIKGDIDRFEDKAVASSDPTFDPFLTSKSARLINIVISDNYVRPAFLGDTSYLTPRNIAAPLVYLELGGGLICDGVSFFGRSTNGDPTQTSLSAIETDPLSGSNYSTALHISNCEFDGFNRPILFAPLKGTLDYFTLKHSKLRAFGPVGGVAAEDSSNVIFCNGCNIDISSNYVWTDSDLMSIVYVDAFTTDPIVNQSRSKISVTNNTLVSDKDSNTMNTMVPLAFKASIVGTASTKCVPFVYGNLYNENTGFSVSADPAGTTAFVINATTATLGSTSTATSVNGATATIFATGEVSITGSSVALANSQYRPINQEYGPTVNIGDTHYIVAVMTNAVNPITVNLPAATTGRVLIIKDAAGYASLNNITIVPSGGITIDGNLNLVISNSWASVTLVFNFGQWIII